MDRLKKENKYITKVARGFSFFFFYFTNLVISTFMQVITFESVEKSVLVLILYLSILF